MPAATERYVRDQLESLARASDVRVKLAQYPQLQDFAALATAGNLLGRPGDVISLPDAEASLVRRSDLSTPADCCQASTSTEQVAAELSEMLAYETDLDALYSNAVKVDDAKYMRRGEIPATPDGLASQVALYLTSAECAGGPASSGAALPKHRPSSQLRVEHSRLRCKPNMSGGKWQVCSDSANPVDLTEPLADGLSFRGWHHILPDLLGDVELYACGVAAADVQTAIQDAHTSDSYHWPVQGHFTDDDNAWPNDWTHCYSKAPSGTTSAECVQRGKYLEDVGRNGHGSQACDGYLTTGTRRQCTSTPPSNCDGRRC